MRQAAQVEKLPFSAKSAAKKATFAMNRLLARIQ
jgi:hypothetical protein